MSMRRNGWFSDLHCNRKMINGMFYWSSEMEHSFIYSLVKYSCHHFSCLKSIFSVTFIRSYQNKWDDSFTVVHFPGWQSSFCANISRDRLYLSISMAVMIRNRVPSADRCRFANWLFGKRSIDWAVPVFAGSLLLLSQFFSLSIGFMSCCIIGVAERYGRQIDKHWNAKKKRVRRMIDKHIQAYEEHDRMNRRKWKESLRRWSIRFA
jgi:hypothetical protein